MSFLMVVHRPSSCPFFQNSCHDHPAQGHGTCHNNPHLDSHGQSKGQKTRETGDDGKLRQDFSVRLFAS